MYLITAQFLADDSMLLLVIHIMSSMMFNELRVVKVYPHNEYPTINDTANEIPNPVSQLEKLILG